MRNLLLISLFLFIALGTYPTVLYAGGGNADAIVGNWLTHEGDAKIEIFKCGNNYCGKIVWLKNPSEKNGKPKLDGKNKDKALEKRALMGLQVLENFEHNYTQGHDVWTGTAYNPKWGSKSSGAIRLKKDGTLAVKGWNGTKKKVGAKWTRDVRENGGIKPPPKLQNTPKSGGR